MEGRALTQTANARERTTPERPQILFFFSKHDGMCRRIEGYLAQVLQRRRNHDTFVLHSVDVNDRPEIAERFRVAEVPTLLVVADRRVQARVTRPRGCRALEELLSPWLR